MESTHYLVNIWPNKERSFNCKIWLESLLVRTWKSRRAHPTKPF